MELVEILNQRATADGSTALSSSARQFGGLRVTSNRFPEPSIELRHEVFGNAFPPTPLCLERLTVSASGSVSLWSF